MSFFRKRYIACDLNTINKVIKHTKDIGGAFFFVPFEPSIHGSIKNNMFIEDGMRFIRATAKYDGRVSTYVFDKTTGKKEDAVQGCDAGMSAWICLCKMVGKENIHRIVNEEDLETGKNVKPFSTSPFIWWSEKYDRTEQQAIDYDMNSAYAYAMLGDMPDTKGVSSVDIVCYNSGIVKEDELGFDVSGNLVDTGCFALYKFKRMKSPFKKFVEYYYTLKSTATNKEARKHAKNILNMSVGFLQRVNPFLRATIVSRANKFIQSLMDENTIYCNTDCIISLSPRNDLKLGDGVGEWKIENQGSFRYVGSNYQWNGEVPTYRGIPKKWFKKGFNILTDEIPYNGNVYELDYLNIKVVRRRL